MSRIANRPLTKPRQPHRLSELAQVVAAITLLIIPAFLYASQRAKLHHAQRRIATLERQLIELEERRQLLRIELATENDPRRIEAKALALTGLREPEPEQVRFLARLSPTDPRRLVAVAGDTDGHP